MTNRYGIIVTDWTIKASTFKERCLVLLDQVVTPGVPIIVTNAAGR